jgi:hypothetical protein
MTLSVLAAEYPQFLDGFRMFGVVKVGLDDRTGITLSRLFSKSSPTHSIVLFFFRKRPLMMKDSLTFNKIIFNFRYTGTNHCPFTRPLGSGT